MGALDGRVVLVTGGGNGIGRECALIAAREGAKVLVNDLGGGERGGDEGSTGPAETVAAEIRAAGGEAVANSDSVTSMAAVKGMVEQALDAFGGLHAVINPAGILRDGMFHKMPDEDWDIVIDVHLRGSYNVCRATIEHFRNQNDGAYVLFTSTSGLIGNVGQANYAAAKLGIMGLSRIIALEGATQERALQHHRAHRLDAADRHNPGQGRGRRGAHGGDEAGAEARTAGQAGGGAGQPGGERGDRPDLRRPLGDSGGVQPAAAGRDGDRRRPLDRGDRS